MFCARSSIGFSYYNVYIYKVEWVKRNDAIFFFFLFFKYVDFKIYICGNFHNACVIKSIRVDISIMLFNTFSTKYFMNLLFYLTRWRCRLPDMTEWPSFRYTYNTFHFIYFLSTFIVLLEWRWWGGGGGGGRICAPIHNIH